MATARQHLVGTSEELRVALSDLTAVDEQVTSLMAGVGTLADQNQVGPETNDDPSAPPRTPVCLVDA